MAGEYENMLPSWLGRTLPRRGTGEPMLKALLALALMIAVIVVAANFMKKNHTTGAPPAGPVVINVPVKNPLS